MSFAGVCIPHIATVQWSNQLRVESPLMSRSFFARLRSWSLSFLGCAVFFCAGWTAQAQFKVTGPAPYTNAVARQKVKTLLEKVDSTNRQQTLDTVDP